MTMLRFFAIVLALSLLAACGSTDEPAPDSGQTAAAPPAESQATEAAPTSPPPAPGTQITPCKVTNVNDKKCTDELGSGLTAILKAQGEGEKAAREAGNAIAKAIQGAPLEKRNGFKMKGPETGKQFTFMFQNINGKCNLQLFNKPDGNSESYEILGSTELPHCLCKE